jgi:hypothetical protein
MYYHRGRLSLAARAWSPALQLELAKAKPKEEPAKAKDAPPKIEEKKDDDPKTEQTAGKTAEKAKEDRRNEEDRAFLKWLDENAKGSFVSWKPFAHPDFADRKVEIGGFAPFAKTNPPEHLLGELARKHAQFLTELAGKLPRIGLRKAEAKHLGDSVYDVTVQVENTGYLPTALAQGSLTREVRPTRVALKVDEQNVLSGTRVTLLNAIPGGEAKEVRWVVRAKNAKTLDVEVVSLLAGRLATNVVLKEGVQ